MPIYVIQKKVNKNDKPFDTIEIEVPGTNKIISAVINNNIINGFILSSRNDLLAERDLRYITNNDVYDIIAFYRSEKPLPEKQQTQEQLLAENQQTGTNTGDIAEGTSSSPREKSDN